MQIEKFANEIFFHTPLVVYVAAQKEFTSACGRDAKPVLHQHVRSCRHHRSVGSGPMRAMGSG
jgi:hypothetical protein